MQQQSDYQVQDALELYPGNWLYNAGVIGFLQSIKYVKEFNSNQKFNIESWIQSDGSVNLKLPLFSDLRIEDRYFGKNKVSSIVGKNNLYPNFLQSNQKNIFKEFVKALDSLEENYCDICANGKSIKPSKIKYINDIDPAKEDSKRFLYRIKKFSIIHYSDLGPSFGKYPNAFWNLNQSLRICHLCNFLIIHHHLALTRLSDGSEIFINAPSFQVMWHLNRLVREMFGSNNANPAFDKRHILAMSIIEYAAKIQSLFGAWMMMNIEIVIREKYLIREKGKKKIEYDISFFSLPYEVVQLLSDKHIASLLSRIGEFSILNLVLDQDYERLIETGYRLLRIGLKPAQERNTSETNFLDYTLYQYQNKESPVRVANQLFKLYAYIIQKQKISKL